MRRYRRRRRKYLDIDPRRGRPITIAVAEPPVRLSRRNKRLVKPVASLLALGMPTPWAFEAATRTGIRVAFIMSGENWHHADQQAAAVVEAALKANGASERPSWIQGQPEYVQGRETCLHCRRPLPDDVMSTRLFCDDACRTAHARRHWRYAQQARAYQRAYRAARRNA